MDDPPTDTNGSGMPVTGAIPTVIPTLIAIWTKSATAIPPATIAENGSRATVMILSARQITSRYSARMIAPPKNPRCSASDAKAKSVASSGR